MNEDLKSCPFCGSTKVAIDGNDDCAFAFAICVGCSADGPPQDTVAKAREAWNWRASTSDHSEESLGKVESELVRSEAKILAGYAYRHKKSGRVYSVLHVATDSTNSRDGRLVVVYRLFNPKTRDRGEQAFARDIDEFRERFELLRFELLMPDD